MKFAKYILGGSALFALICLCGVATFQEYRRPSGGGLADVEALPSTNPKSIPASEVTTTPVDQAESSSEAASSEQYPSTGVAMFDPFEAPIGPLPDESQLTAEEEMKAILVADEYLKAEEAEFKVKRKSFGFSVFVEFFQVNAHGEKLYMSGGHCLIYLSSDFRVGYVVGGL